MNLSKFVLGSAQFGLDYGISNEKGKVSEKEIKNILKVAYQNGIRTIDTAKAYGNAEEVLGKINSNNFQYITKISSPKKNESVENYIFRLENEVEDSLNLLKTDLFEAILIHDSSVLLTELKYPLINFLESLKFKGKTKKVGVSVYSPKEISIIFNCFTPDIIQLPLNLFDQRFLESNLLNSLKHDGIEIHSRSIFLQGLLLMQPEQLPEKAIGLFNPLKEMLDYFKKKKVSIVQEAIKFVNEQNDVDKIILGVTQKEELINCLSCEEVVQEIDYKKFAIKDYELIDPRRW